MVLLHFGKYQKCDTLVEVDIPSVIDQRKVRVGSRLQKQYLIRFRSGYEYWVFASSLAAGSYRDRLAPSVHGHGIVGFAAVRKNKRAYQKWANMLARCFDKEYQAARPGAPVPTVCERWLRFDYFLADLPQLPGYSDFAAGKRVALDKDLIIPGNTVYAPGRVQFVTERKNSEQARERIIARAHALRKQVRYLETGEVFESVLQASRQTKTCRKTISAHCNGERSEPRWEYA